MKTYKCRAEVIQDILGILSLAPQLFYDFSVKRINNCIPDVEFEFTSTHQKKEIVEYFIQIPDTHVMVDTLELKENYTGERK